MSQNILPSISFLFFQVDGIAYKPNSKIITPIPKFSCSGCLLCQRGTPYILLKKPTWENKLYLSMYVLNNMKRRPPNSFINLKKELYPFIEYHHNLLQFKSLDKNWRKKLQDILNHKKVIFESGCKEFRSTGFWRSKPIVNPWSLKTTIKKTLNNSKQIHM